MIYINFKAIWKYLSMAMVVFGVVILDKVIDIFDLEVYFAFMIVGTLWQVYNLQDRVDRLEG